MPPSPQLRPMIRALECTNSIIGRMPQQDKAQISGTESHLRSSFAACMKGTSLSGHEEERVSRCVGYGLTFSGQLKADSWRQQGKGTPEACCLK